VLLSPIHLATYSLTQRPTRVACSDISDATSTVTTSNPVDVVAVLNARSEVPCHFFSDESSDVWTPFKKYSKSEYLHFKIISVIRRIVLACSCEFRLTHRMRELIESLFWSSFLWLFHFSGRKLSQTPRRIPYTISPPTAVRSQLCQRNEGAFGDDIVASSDIAD
jgi:hypothetical protein